MSPEDPLDRLIADWLSDSITPEDFRTLDARLRTDPAARAALRRTASLDAALRDWATRQEISAAWTAADTPAPEISSTRATSSLFRRWRWPLAAAAAVARPSSHAACPTAMSGAAMLAPLMNRTASGTTPRMATMSPATMREL